MVTEATREQPTNRPYPPPSNVVTLLHRLRSRNLPEQIDAEYLRDSGIPEGTIARTLFAMRFLGLITEAGEPSQALKSIAVSTNEEYQSILSGLIREAYREVFNVIDPAEDTQDRILNVFRRYIPASQRDRMVIFFLGMCREAGIPTLDIPRLRRMSTAKTLRQETKATTSTAKKERVTVRSVAPGIDPALDGLVRSLPAAGTPLSQERRKQWLEMAEATLKFVYPDNMATTKEQERAGSEEEKE